jgi:hypothetical protein
MPRWKEFRFKIVGEKNGVALTPTTFPLARLTLYLADLAQLLGHSESVHLIRIEAGSAQPVFYIDADEESRVTTRVQQAKRGTGPSKANRAYRKLDNKLREDNASATFVNISEQAEVVEFPGINLHVPDMYGPIKEQASVIGRLKRLGGFDPTIPIHLQRADGLILCCEANDLIAKQLAPFYEQTVRVYGLATYTRGKEGAWKMESFTIQSFDPEPLSDESFSRTMERLREVAGNGWAEVADPLEELRKIRQGEENIPQ